VATSDRTNNPTLVGERHAWHTHRVRTFLDRNLVEYRWVDADSDEGRGLLVDAFGGAAPALPALVLADGSAVAQPSNVEIARRLGIATTPSRDVYDLVVVGAGPAGLAAAVYGASEGLSTVLIEREAPGGQAGQSSKIENYLGFPDGLPGAELMRRATRQARDFGAEIVQPTSAISLEPAGEEGTSRVQLSNHTVLTASSTVIATGVQYRRLRAPGVADLTGAGVYYGASPRAAAEHAGRRVFVVGAANSAGQAAVHFAEHACEVTMLVRGPSLAQRMSRYLVDKIDAAENIEVLTGTELAEAHGSSRLEAISLAGDHAGRVETDGVFVFIGAVPHTEWLDGMLACDEHGFVLAGRDLVDRHPDLVRGPGGRDPYALESSVPGVFVAGDARHGSVKRVAAAVGEGAMAVQLVHRYLSEAGRAG
jgi:thioredoxin reductase (NADPH)